MAAPCEMEKATGAAGMAGMACIGFWPLAPSLCSGGSIEPESFFLFALWPVLGPLFFRNILHREKQDIYGRSPAVWRALLSLPHSLCLPRLDEPVGHEGGRGRYQRRAAHTSFEANLTKNVSIPRRRATFRGSLFQNRVRCGSSRSAMGSPSRWPSAM